MVGPKTHLTAQQFCTLKDGQSLIRWSGWLESGRQASEELLPGQPL